MNPSGTETTWRRAGPSDVETLVALVNAAFRIEAFFVTGDRTNLEEVKASLEKGAWLLAEKEARGVACVFVEVHGKSGHFAMLAVEPQSQGQGLGRLLVCAAEDLCRQEGCSTIDLLLVNLRTELPDFYRKLGYRETGTSPFPAKSKLPCHFVRLEKSLSQRG
jgi:N-acetylglutamate synthase-like GNAT family acetyltransferase